MPNEFVNKLLIRLCQQPRSFEFLSTSMHGLDPVSLLNTLTNLVSEGHLFKAEDLWVVTAVPSNSLRSGLANDRHQYLKKHMGHFGYLGHPHPLDFEWRNSMTSLKTLLSRVQRLLMPDDKILLLGMPTLFALASQNEIAQPVTLVDRNAPITSGLEAVVERTKQFKIINSDIIKANPKDLGEHFCAVMDPPWYSPFFYQFIWMAANCITTGGFVAISLPPINTRPNILEERNDWFIYCRQLGLCVESLYSQELQYAMPFFEFNSFRAAGLTDILPFWRKGDLVILRKMEHLEVRRPAFEISDNIWTEREIQSVRLRINNQDCDKLNNEILKIESIIPGDILPTVSKREANRARANLWSSGNRIFNVSNPNLFLSVFDGNNKNSDDPNFGIVESFLKMITELEQKEYENYLMWMYHEMERQDN